MQSVHAVNPRAAASAGRELVRAVEINEVVKRIAVIAAQIDMMAINAILLARRAGDRARGFGVLSNELRAFTVEVSSKMSVLRETTFRVVSNVSAILQEGQRLALLDRAFRALERAGVARMLDETIARRDAEQDARMTGFARLRRTLNDALHEADGLGQLGSVLARTARIEAAYGGTHAADLSNVAGEFDQTIQHMLEALTQLRRAMHMTTGRTPAAPT